MSKRLLLRISTSYFVAGAVWEKRGGEWQCIRAAPIIGYMLKMNRQQIANYLYIKQWAYEWIEVAETFELRD